MVVRKSHAWRLADVLLDEGLEEFVQRHRTAGLSWRRITRELYEVTDHQVDVAPETLRSWLSNPGLPDDDESAA